MGLCLWRLYGDSGACLRLQLQDDRRTGSPCQGVRVEQRRQRPGRPGPRHTDGGRFHRLEVPRHPGRRRWRVGIAHRDKAVARRGGRRALGAVARGTDNAQSCRGTGLVGPGLRCRRTVGRHSRHHRRGRPIFQGSDQRRRGALFGGSGRGSRVDVSCHRRSNQPARTDQATSVRLRRCDPRHRVRTQDGRRLGYRARLDAVDVTAWMGRGASTADLTSSPRPVAHRRTHLRVSRPDVVVCREA